MIELINVSGGYGKRKIISNVNLTFPKGEITSIIGANGCGKSTLLMLCAGLLNPSAGKILLDGEDLSKLPRNAIAKRISYLGQIKHSGNLSVRALVSHGRFPYLGYPRKYTAEDCEKINAAMELAGVSEISGETASELSGGQQQRVHIAMLLAQDTDVILLDEPLTYLDLAHQFELMELVTQLKAMGKTVIMILHDLNLALTYSDKTAVMQNGEMVAFDAPDIIAGSGVLKSALGVEAAYCAEAKQYFFYANTFH